MDVNFYFINLILLISVYQNAFNKIIYIYTAINVKFQQKVSITFQL